MYDALICSKLGTQAQGDVCRFGKSEYSPIFLLILGIYFICTFMGVVLNTQTILFFINKNGRDFSKQGDQIHGYFGRFGNRVILLLIRPSAPDYDAYYHSSNWSSSKSFLFYLFSLIHPKHVLFTT